MFSRVTHLILYRTFIVERLLMALGWTSFVSLWGCLLSWWSCATHQRWWQGYPGAYRDQPGWHPWFTCCRGSPYHQRCTVGFFFELQNIWKKEQVTIRDHACRVYNTTSFCISSVLCFFFFYFPQSAGRWYDQSCCCGCSRNGASMCGWCWWHHGGLRCCKTHGGLRHSDRGTHPYHWRKHRRGDGGWGSNSPLAANVLNRLGAPLGVHRPPAQQPDRTRLDIEIESQHFSTWQDCFLPAMGPWSRLAKVPPQLSGSFGTIMKWADEVRDMKARTPAKQWCLPSRMHPLPWIFAFEVSREIIRSIMA